MSDTTSCCIRSSLRGPSVATSRTGLNTLSTQEKNYANKVIQSEHLITFGQVSTRFAIPKSVISAQKLMSTLVIATDIPVDSRDRPTSEIIVQDAWNVVRFGFFFSNTCRDSYVTCGHLLTLKTESNLVLSATRRTPMSVIRNTPSRLRTFRMGQTSAKYDRPFKSKA